MEDVCPVDYDGGADPLGDDAIVLGAGTYVLSLSGGTDNTNASDDLDVLNSGTLAITGQGAGTTTIDGAGVNRVIDLPANATLTIGGPGVGMTITGGDSTVEGAATDEGGGIWARSGTQLTVEDSTISGNTAGGNGGGIDSANDLTVINTTVSGNTAKNNRGGGIRAAETVAISDSTISANKVANTVQPEGGGIAITSFDGMATISGTEVTGNMAHDPDDVTQNGGRGGGIAVTADADGNPNTVELLITDTLIDDNSTERDAGQFGVGGGLLTDGQGTNSDPDVLVQDSAITNNVAGNRGGGVFNDDGARLTLERTSVSANEVSADDLMPMSIEVWGGGGIASDATPSSVTLRDSVVADSMLKTLSIEDDDFLRGGAIQISNGTLLVERSAILDNELMGGDGNNQSGGGIHQSGAGVNTTIVNSTIAGNTVPGVGGDGGAISRSSPTGDTKVIGTTVSGNTAAGSGDAFNVGSDVTGNFAVSNSIVDAGGDPCEGSVDPDAASANNVFAAGLADCWGAVPATNVEIGDPIFSGDPADNGGPEAGRPGARIPVPTYALGPGHGALDHVPTADCLDDFTFTTGPSGAALGSDQRGSVRPFGAGCDAGSFEFKDSDGDGVDDAVDVTPFGDPAPPASAPSNDFAFGKLKRKKKNGTATLTLILPGPGEIGLQGKGIAGIGLTRLAQASRFVGGGRVKLKIKPGKGKKARSLRRRLDAKGKAKLKLRVTFIPTGGTANTRKRKLKLVKR